jgi:peptidoglycan/LPS O-acetylase OafA/YrhL
VNPLYSLLPLAVALAISWLLVKRFGELEVQGRFAAIDGLRGFLAFFVFLHHSMAMFVYLRTGHWNDPLPHLYTHFGRSSVSFFFMITAFLFYSKLIDGKRFPIDWLKLFVSRVLRLFPLYCVFLLAVGFTIACLLNFQFHEDTSSLMLKAMKWGSFTIFGGPIIEGVDSNYLVIMAGATWSLPYEWFFYFSLPALALTIRLVPPLFLLFASFFALLAFALWEPNSLNIFAFTGGVMAAFIVRKDWLRSWFSGRNGSLLAIASLVFVVVFFPTAGYVAHLFLFLIFIAIACGNTLFGILSSASARMLGQISYSIYLLHGLVLFAVFKFLVGFEKAALISATGHWLIISATSAFLILFCYITFRFVEAPGMAYVPIATARIRRIYQRRGASCTSR